MASAESERSEKSRVWWRSRRGLLELDLLLLPFVEQRFERLTVPQRRAYVELLECDDQDIWAWLQARATPDGTRFDEIIALILECNARGG